MTSNSIDIKAMQLFEFACERPSDARITWIKSATKGQPALRERVLSLLEQDKSKDSIVATGQAIRAAYKNTESKIPSHIGSYTITRLIGEGGMGAVYEGVRNNDDFDLRVAIKVIKPGLLSDSVTDRFVRERQVLAGLNHPGIARLFDGGQLEDGSPYFVMEFVDGTPITQYAQDNTLSIYERLALFMQVCEATKHAHANLIVHRDITTSNVIVSADGTVKLIDFGISKPYSDDAPETASYQPSLASLSFTPGFAAPERLIGAPVTILTDVFSLGRLLDALLKDKDVPPELQLLMNKATERRPEDRLSSVDAFQADIDRFLTHHPLSVAERKLGYVSKKFWQRNKIPSLLGATLAFAILSGLLTSLTLADRARTEARIAKENLARSEYYLARSEIFLFGNNAYADVLQRLFGNSTDIQNQTTLLKARWQEAYDNRAEDPENAASLSFAIGRHFMFRNDYKTALEIFEPWFEEGYGDPLLINISKSLLATTYGRLGRGNEAIPIYREVVAWMETGYDSGSPDHISAASKLARLTRSEQDLIKAEALLESGLNGESGKEPQLASFYWGQLSTLREIRGDFEGVYQARVASLKLLEDNPLLEISARDTVVLNVGFLEFYLAKDLAEAGEMAQQGLDISKTKGESGQMGRAYFLQSLLRAHDGQLDDAVAKAEKAAALLERYSGPKSPSTIDARAWLVEAYAQNGNAALASEALDALEQTVVEASLDQSAKTRLALCRAFVAGQFPSQVSSSALSPEDKDAIKRSITLSYQYNQLLNAGFLTP